MAIPYVGNVNPNELPMPTFQCWDEDNGSEEATKTVRGWDESMAAEIFAMERWRGDRPDEQRVCVRDASGKVSRFVVRAEMVPEFTARPVDESDG
jgi:hypothetical protein